ncbi:MAG: hypothetical protein LBJ77_02060 [Holosporales bacterium]|jgi:hypothetical protein|nr:hypothetical protein [Holosporales bacterium]
MKIFNKFADKNVGNRGVFWGLVAQFCGTSMGPVVNLTTFPNFYSSAWSMGD